MMFIFLMIITNLLLSISNEENPRKLRKQKSGIEIYTRPVNGSSFDEFKGLVALTNTSVNEVLAIILNVENYTSLYPNCINAKILEHKTKYHDIYYFSLKAPWPVKTEMPFMNQLL